MFNEHGQPLTQPEFCAAFPVCQEKAAPGSVACTLHGKEESPC